MDQAGPLGESATAAPLLRPLTSTDNATDFFNCVCAIANTRDTELLLCGNKVTIIFAGAGRKAAIAAELAGVSGQAKLSALGPCQMDISALGVSLMVGGLALVVSGLVFLLPITRQISGKNESFEESQARTEYYLQQMREQRGER